MNSKPENNKAVENTKAQMRKGVLEMCILSIIAEAKEAYPSDILTKIENMSDNTSNEKLIVKQGTLYPLLARMKKAGWLHYTWKESDQGPPRKYYHITEEGSTFLSLLFGAWKDLVNVVNLSTQSLQSPKKKATKSKKTTTKSDSTS